MSELHDRYNLGIESLHIGRITLARPLLPVQDDVASSLQPSIAPGTTDVQAPLESQARGFTHGHGKGHSTIGATMSWVRKAVSSGFTAALRTFRAALCVMASTVQYDAAREPARQIGEDRRPEPFTAKQQRQSRLDGGEEEDGAPRDHVELAPPVERPPMKATSRDRPAMEVLTCQCVRTSGSPVLTWRQASAPSWFSFTSPQRTATVG